MSINSKVIITPETQVSGKKTLMALVKTRFIVLFVIIGSMIGVALISRFALIDNSVRLDEAQSLWQTSHSLLGTLEVVARDVHVPLYHVLLHFWTLYFGDSITSARIMSLGFFLATIPIVYLLAREILSRNWSLFVVTLFSFSPFMNWYANEARMYTLLVFIAVLNQYFFLKMIKRDKGWLGWTITAVIGAFSHYFFLFNLATQGVFFLLNRKKFGPNAFKKVTAVAALVVAALTPWLLYFRSEGSASNTTPLLPNPSTVDFFNAYSNFLYGFQNDQINTILVSFWPLLVLVALFAIRRNQRISTEFSYILMISLFPIVLAYIVSLLITPFFLSRYMVSSVAALLIIVVWFISNYGKRFAYIAASALLVVTAVASINQNVSASTPVKEDYQSVANDVNRWVTPKDIVVLSAPFTVYPFQYYYTGSASISTLPIWNQNVPGSIPAFSSERLPDEVNKLKQDHQYLYLIQSQDQGYEEEIKTYFDRNFERTMVKQYSPGMSMYVYRVNYSQVPSLELIRQQNLVKASAQQ